MRYIIYGAGAIGGVTGARLFEHGREVILIARGEHLKAIQQKGLTFSAPGESEQVFNIPAVSHPREITWRSDDVVFLTMKTQDTEGALADLEATAGCDVPVFCIQNGVDNERLVARRFAHTYGIHVSMSCTYLTPGVVSAENGPITGILDPGCYPTGIDETARRVAADIDQCKLSSIPQPDIMRWKYTKMLGNLNNGIQVVCGLKGDTAAIRNAIREEGIRIYKAAGIDYASEEENVERRKVLTRGGGNSGGSSTYQSIARGLTTVEVDYLNGEVVLLARQYGVPAPMNEAVRRLANEIAREGKQPGAYTPADVQQLADKLAGAVPAR